MGRIAIVSRSQCEREDFFQYLSIPDDYMADFSVLGIVVDDYPESIDLLKEQGYSINQLGPGSLIAFDHAASVPEIVDLLTGRGIRVDYLDIANHFYQA